MVTAIVYMFMFILIDLFYFLSLDQWSRHKLATFSGLYKAHRGADCATPGLSILPKLKWEHIELNSYSKMRVDLASQVRSILE